MVEDVLCFEDVFREGASGVEAALLQLSPAGELRVHLFSFVEYCLC